MESITTFNRAFSLVEDYASYLLHYPEDATPAGSIYIFQIEELDAVWLKVGDGKTALIDLPNIIIR